jgi:hypothetical protein
LIFIVSSNVDDTIRNSSIHSDIKVFKTFKYLEDYIEINPVDVDTIIINSKDLMFTNTSMNRIVNILNSTFVTLSGYLYYLVDDEEIKNKVDFLCIKNNYNNIKCLYLSTLHAKDISDIITGESLQSKETITEIKTYRIRASDYIRQQKDKEGLNYSEIYETDEDELSNIKDESIPEDLRVSIKKRIERVTISGDYIKERTSWVLLKAQYLSTIGKVLLLEKDINYHILYDYMSKLEIDYEFFDISLLFRDCYDVISQIKSSKSKIILIGSKNRIQYNYDIILNILYSNLKEDLDYYIYETKLNEIPYGNVVDLVIPTNVPDILSSINNMSSILSFKDINFIGININKLGLINLSELEFTSILKESLQENEINSKVVETNGLILRKEIGLSGIFMYN